MRIGAELLSLARRRVSPLGDANVVSGVAGIATVLPVAGLGAGLGQSSSGGSSGTRTATGPYAVLTSPAALSQYGLRLWLSGSSGEIIVGGPVRVFALYSE